MRAPPNRPAFAPGSLPQRPNEVDTTVVAQPDHWSIGSTIIRAVVGSTCHGLNIEDGIEDRDEMGICAEPFHVVAGLNTFEQYIYRSAAIRENDHNARSRSGDLDLTIYGLRKYVRLALKGNPTIISLLFIPRERVILINSFGLELQALAPSIVSRSAGGAFLGYLQAQRQRMMHERGGRHGSRPELESRFGYDCKYAMHMARLGLQGVELLTTGRISLPVPQPEREWLRSIRRGEVELQEILTRSGELEAELKDLLDASPLPNKPDFKKVENWLLSVYERSWNL